MCVCVVHTMYIVHTLWDSVNIYICLSIDGVVWFPYHVCALFNGRFLTLHRLLAFDFWLHFSTAWNIKPFEHEKSGERLFNSATYITVTIWYETLSHLSTYSRVKIILENDKEYWIFILISIDIRFSFNNQKIYHQFNTHQRTNHRGIAFIRQSWHHNEMENIEWEHIKQDAHDE